MKVEAFLPHRDPFLFIDEVIEVSNEKIVAKRFVSPEEEFLRTFSRLSNHARSFNSRSNGTKLWIIGFTHNEARSY